MYVIRARNINEVWDHCKILLNENHVVRPSRVGEVWESPEPVTTVYERPLERVLFNAVRNANPYFHFMESLHLLAGRNDVAWLERFNSKITEFVGSSPEQHGAYGYRLRFAFDMDGGAEDGYADQFQKVVRMLKKSPDERRAVLTMWNPLWDLERPDIKDVPCNTQVYVKIRDQKLCIVVTCRSNDVCYGAYGSNVCQFSFLQEYLAYMIGVPVGTYYQVSDSWHAYTERWTPMGGLDLTPTVDYYQTSASPYRLVDVPDVFDAELLEWMERAPDMDMNRLNGFGNTFFLHVAERLWLSWEAYKRNDFTEAYNQAGMCAASDWRIAAIEWLDRVQEKRQRKVSA